jgi:hypothetical protein
MIKVIGLAALIGIVSNCADIQGRRFGDGILVVIAECCVVGTSNCPIDETSLKSDDLAPVFQVVGDGKFLRERWIVRTNFHVVGSLPHLGVDRPGSCILWSFGVVRHFKTNVFSPIFQRLGRFPAVPFFFAKRHEPFDSNESRCWFSPAIDVLHQYLDGLANRQVTFHCRLCGVNQALSPASAA